MINEKEKINKNEPQAALNEEKENDEIKKKEMMIAKKRRRKEIIEELIASYQYKETLELLKKKD